MVASNGTDRSRVHAFRILTIVFFLFIYAMDVSLLCSGRVHIDRNIETQQTFADTIRISQNLVLESGANFPVPRSVDIKGTLQLDNAQTGTSTAIEPPLNVFGGKDSGSYLQFIHPGKGLGGPFNAFPRVPMNESRGSQNGVVSLHHETRAIETVVAFGRETADPERVVKSLDVDEHGHVRKLETVDLKLVYDGTQAQIDAEKDTFVPNTYPLYNDTRVDEGRLFLEWYTGVTEDLGRDAARIGQGRFLSFPIQTTIASNGDERFRGSIVTRSGYVVFVPFDATVIYAWNPRTGIEKTSEVGNARFAGGCLLPDDRVLLAPFDGAGNTVRMYDPVSNTLDTLGGTLRSGFWGAVVHPSGTIVLVPSTSDQIVFLDSETFQVKPEWSIDVSGQNRSEPLTSRYAGGVLDARGRIWLVPHDNDTADVVVFPSIGPPVLQTGPYVGMNPAWELNRPAGIADAKRCIGGSLTYDGRIVMSAYTIRPDVTFVIVDANQETEDIETASVVRIPETLDPGINVFTEAKHGTFVLPDGRVAAVPHARAEITLFDPQTDATSNLDIVPSAQRYGGAVVLEDGRVVFAPSNGTQPGVYIQPVRSPRDMIYHPVWNRG